MAINDKSSRLEQFALDFCHNFVNSDKFVERGIETVKEYKDVLPSDLAFELLSVLTEKLIK